jgi:hypothetical protein
MIAGGIGNISAQHTHKNDIPSAACWCSWAALACASAWAARRVVDGHRHQHGRPGLRLGPARQPKWNAARRK